MFSKHTVLVALVRAMQEKPAGIHFFDTHAGAARYDLALGMGTEDPGYSSRELSVYGRTSPDAGPLADYLEQVKRLNPDGKLRYYPGSPLLLRQLLRPADRLTLLRTASG